MIRRDRTAARMSGVLCAGCSISALMVILQCAPALAQTQANPASTVPGTAGTVATPAVATATSNGNGSSTAADAVPTGEITVTARKRSESLLKVPVAVSAITADGLSARGILNPVALNDFVPGFRDLPQSGSNTARSFNGYIIRGLNPNSLHPDRQNVGVFIDGISVGGAGNIPGLDDVERVEVVKGPQSAYFGRATFAGAVNFVTKPPSLTDYHAGVDASVTSRGSTDDRAYIEGPIIHDVLAVRVDGEHNYFDSGYKNYGYGGDLGNQKTDSFSVSGVFKPAEFIRFRAFYTQYGEHDDGNATEYLTPSAQNCNLISSPKTGYFCGGISSEPASTIAQNQTLTPALLQQLKAGDQAVGPDFPAAYGMKRLGHFGYISNDIDLPHSFTLSSYYAWQGSSFQLIQDGSQRYDTINRYSTSLTAYNVRNNVAEARLSSDQGKRLKAMIGFNYFDQTTTSDSLTLRTGTVGVITGLAPQQQDTHTYGIFGSISYDITDRLTASFEARRQIDDIRFFVLANPAGANVGSTKSFTPRGILQYKLNPRLNLYASYSEGRRPSQFNTAIYALSPANLARVEAVTPVPLLVPEERITMAEVGLRGNLFDRKVTILTDVYYGWWRDRQASPTIYYTNTAGVATSALAVLPNGSINVYGVEFETMIRPTTHLTLEGTFAYNDTDIRYSICPQCVNINGISDNVGKRLPGYAPYTGSLAATYRQPLDDNWDAFLRADYIYTGKIYADETNIAHLDAGNRVNLRVGVDSKLYKLEVFATNVLNDKTPLGISSTTDTYVSSQNTLALTPPPLRTVGVRFAASF